MKRIRTRRILGVAALLLASGCDFWDGLVGEKTLTRALLTIFALDALNDGPMPYVHCRDSARGLEINFDASGIHHTAAAATGEFKLVCTSRWYFPESLLLSVTTAGAIDTIRFARMPGDTNWYTDEAWQVRLPLLDQSLRYPMRLDWIAQPADERGRFRYAWTFSSTPRLNQVHAGREVLPAHLRPVYAADANAAIGVQPGPDTVCLTVYSRLNGPDQEYEVGKDCRSFDWVRNKPPVIRLDPDSVVATYKVGCGANPVRPRIVAHDSDGVCQSIRLFANDTLSSLRKLNLTLPCKESQFTSLPLLPPANPVDAKNADGKFPTTLYAEIIDDNNEKSFDTLEFLTYPNFAPKAKAGLRLPRKVYFPGDSVWFWVEGNDTDGTIEKSTFYWGGYGQDEIPSPVSQQQSVRADTFHVFQEPDSILVDAWASDNCEEPGHAWVPLEIRKNTPPTILFDQPAKVRDNDTLFHQFLLTVRDQDISNQIDSLTRVKIYWDDGKSTTFSTLNGQRPQNQIIKHHYAKPPVNGSTFSIRIEVNDAHQGTAFLDTLLAY